MLEQILNGITNRAEKKIQSIIENKNNRITFVKEVCNLLQNYELTTTNGNLAITLNSKLTFDEYNKIIEIATNIDELLLYHITFKNRGEAISIRTDVNKYEFDKLAINRLLIDIHTL